jgi:hypothetical protein
MIQFINMDFNGTQWWVEYLEDNIIKKDFFNTEIEANNFYLSIIN